MFKEKLSKLLIPGIVLVVLLFGGFFAYSVHGYVVYRRDVQTAQEDTEATRSIFDDWLANMLPAAVLTPTPQPEAPPADTYAAAGTLLPAGTPAPDALATIDETVFEEIYEEPPAPCFFTLLEAFRTETRNPEIIAFINVPGTNIQYVVAQSGCNEFYLNHNMFRRRNAAGTIFLDYRNSADFTDPNSILYGHHMRNGTKFTQVRNFRNRTFFRENRYIQLFTENGLFEYEIFAVFTTNISFNYIQTDFAEGEFAALINEMLARSYHNAGIPVTENDRLLVLSTCHGSDDEIRHVLVGRKM